MTMTGHVMEVPVRVAVKIRNQCIGPASISIDNGGIRTGDGRLFPVETATSGHGSNFALYRAIAVPQLACLLDGCDTSIVVLGQSGTGKSYTLLGPDDNSIYDDDQEQGIIPRFLCDVFRTLENMPERNYVIHITWMRVLNGGVTDLLGCGLAKCSNFEEALKYLIKGSADKCYDPCHTVFTVSIEQKWITPGGILYHRLSTASFCELSAYPEASLLSLEQVIRDLLNVIDRKQINYEKSLLTAMLRDSFGGRAFTWILACLDANPLNIQETLKNLELCWCCRGIRNFVTVNGFADNNIPLSIEKNTNIQNDQYFGLKFASQQWIKLITNAEGLFQSILQSNMLSKTEVAQINEWLFLKAECDECFNPKMVGLGETGEETEIDNNKNMLPRITEDTEPSELNDSDADSDTSLQHDDFLFTDKLHKFMDYFKEKTDQLAFDRCEEYLHCGGALNLETSDTGVSESSAQMGRRKTIQPGENLTGDELELLRKAAAIAVSPESQKIILESKKAYEDPEPKLVQRELLKMIDSPVPNELCKKYKTLLQKYNLKQNLITKLSKNIHDNEIQLKELISLCIAKEQLIQDLSKIMKRQSNTKACLEKQYNLNQELKKAEADLIVIQTKLVNDSKNPKLIQQANKLKSIIDHLERRSLDQKLEKRLDADNNKEIKKHETKLKSYKKQIEQIKKQIKRDEKRKNTLELELFKDKSKLDEFKNQENENLTSEPKRKDNKYQNTLKQVSVRISNLDHILKEKTSDLQKSDLSDDKEMMLRREIKNLRKTRECLIDQRCVLSNKRKIHKSLSDTEERKFLEYEEAIEAIDTAIEYKNELICGRGQIVMNVNGPKERGEELLMARLSKLSDNEMRTLLYKYFQKVIDLRTTCASLEAATGAAQQEASGWRQRCGDAWTALQHARLAYARRTTTLTARHYHTLNQLMNEMTGNMENNNFICNGINNKIPLPLEYPQKLNNILESDMENVLTQHSRIASTMTKVKVRDNTMEGNTRILKGFQEVQIRHSGIPSRNLKQLQITNSDPMTKVTREKNKLVIIQEEKPNK